MSVFKQNSKSKKWISSLMLLMFIFRGTICDTKLWKQQYLSFRPHQYRYNWWLQKLQNVHRPHQGTWSFNTYFYILIGYKSNIHLVCQFYNLFHYQGAIFIRDCSDCVIVVACGQFRTRDCRNIETFLCCSTQPIIEATVKIR